MLITKKPNYLLLKASLVLSLIIFSFYLLFQLDLIELIINSDRSKISLIILVIYLLATLHWFYIAISLDKEISSIDKPEIDTLIGYNSIYKPPINPDLIIDTSKKTIDECTYDLIQYFNLPIIKN